MANVPSHGDNHSEVHVQMKLEVFKEHLRQARYSFNLSVVAFAASISISVIGACLLFSNKAHEGAVTAATGLLSITFCTQLTQQSSEKLEELTETIEILHRKEL